MAEPYSSIYMALMAFNHPDRVWRYNVKNNGEAIYVGNDHCHVTILAGQDGFHLTENGFNYPHQGNITSIYGIENYVCPNIREPMEEGEIVEAGRYISDARARIINTLNVLYWKMVEIGRV